jgi:hypothetical protein
VGEYATRPQRITAPERGRPVQPVVAESEDPAAIGVFGRIIEDAKDDNHVAKPIAGPRHEGKRVRATVPAARPASATPQHRTADATSKVPDFFDMPIAGELSPEQELARNPIADDYLVENPSSVTLRADISAVLQTIESSQMITDDLAAILTPWAMADRIAPPQNFLARRHLELQGASVTEVDQWAPVLTRQRSVLRETAANISQLLALLKASGATPGNILLGHPAMELLAAFANTAGASAHSMAAGTMLRNAQLALTKLPMASLAYQAKNVRDDSLQLAREEITQPDNVPAQSTQIAQDGAYAVSRVDALARAQEMGAAPTAEEITGTSLLISVTEYRHQVSSLQMALRQLRGALTEASSGFVVKVLFPNNFTAEMMRRELAASDAALGTVETELAKALIDAPEKSPQALNAAQQKVRAAQTHFTNVMSKYHLDGDLFARAQDEIHDARIRQVLADVLLTVAIAFASGGVGAFAGRTVATAEAVVGLSRAARIASVVTSVTVDSAVFSTVETARHANSSNAQLGASFLENLILNTAVISALRPFQTMTHALIGADQAAVSAFYAKAGFAKSVAIKGGIASAEIFTAIVVNALGRKVIDAAHGRTPTDEELTSWTLEAASMALGKMIHVHMDQQVTRLSSAGDRAGRLIGQILHKRSLAWKLQTAPDPQTALSLLVAHRELLASEAVLWRDLAADPTRLRNLGFTAEQATGKRATVEAQLVTTAEQASGRLALQLGRLTEEVPGGRIWSGSHDDINAAIAHARKLGATVDILDGSADISTVNASPLADAPAAPNADITPANDGLPRSRVVKIILNGEPLVIRETVSAARKAKVVNGTANSSMAQSGALREFAHLTANDFVGIKDPKLRQIQTLAMRENDDLAVRVDQVLKRAGVEHYEIQHRAKSVASILGKLQETPASTLGEIKDLSGIRVNLKKIERADWAQYDSIRDLLKAELGIADHAIKDYNATPNAWGYTGRVHLFNEGAAGVVSEIQLGSLDLSSFIEKRFLFRSGKSVELHDLNRLQRKSVRKCCPCRATSRL